MLKLSTNIDKMINGAWKNMKSAVIKAESRANQRAARTIIKEFINELQKDYAVKDKIKRDLQVRTKRNEDGSRGASALIIAKGKHGIALSRFQSRQVKSGVSFTVSISKGRKLMQHAFIAKMKSGHVGIYVRAGKGRLPIQQKFGPDVKMLLDTPRMMMLHKRVLAEVYPKYYAHELKYQLGKWVKG